MLAFALASLALMAIPGPDMALIMRNAVVHGRRTGLATMLGGLAGISVHATASVVGLSALLATSATAFAVVKLVGAIYLTLLGVRALRHAAGRARAAQAQAAQEPTEPLPHRQAMRQGWLSNVLNPKAAVFFVTFLPQFLPAGEPAFPRSLALMAIFALIYASWFCALVAGVDRAARWLRRARVQAWLERVTGACLLAFGARLALARH
ncbi:MAG TPA: LysE family translocator [Solirubrobacteraceae bacterium]